MSIGIKKTFNLDMVPGGAPPIIHVSAGDVGRPFRAVLLYNGETYDLDDVTSVKIRGTKPDNTVFEYALTFDTEDSHVDFVIEEQMAIIAGQVLCEIRLFSGEDTIGSANFILDVETAVYDPEAASESYIPSFENAIQEALENVADDIADLATAAAINDVKQYADDAEAWATGSVDGTDVTSTDDQYHNNAKYYSEQAGEKATAAAGSATAAAASAAEAMSGTPDGYATLVNTVNTLDSNIGTTYDLVTTGTASLKAVLEQGGLANDAYHQPTARTNRVRTACPFHINGNEITITWTGENIEAFIYQYGNDNNFIRYDGWETGGYASFTPNADTEYLDLVFRKHVNGSEVNLTPADVGTLSITETRTNGMFACVTVSITFSYESTTPPARGFQYRSPSAYSSYIGSGYEPVGNVTTSVGASNMYMVFPFLYQNVMYVNVYALTTNSVSNGYATCKFFFVKSALLNQYTLTN